MYLLHNTPGLSWEDLKARRGNACKIGPKDQNHLEEYALTYMAGDARTISEPWPNISLHGLCVLTKMKVIPRGHDKTILLFMAYAQKSHYHLRHTQLQGKVIQNLWVGMILRPHQANRSLYSCLPISNRKKVWNQKHSTV